MKNKKILILFCLLIVFLLSFSIVSAKDNTTTKTKINDNTKTVNKDKVVQSENNKNIKTNNKKTNKTIAKDKNIPKKYTYNLPKKSIKSAWYYDKELDEYIEEEDYYDEYNYYEREYLQINSKSTAYANQKIKITVKATNHTSKLKVGKVRVKFNKKTITTKAVKNGKITLNYRLPKKSGTYKITAEYIKGKKLVIKTKNITVKDLDKLKFSISSKTYTPGSKYTFIAKVTNPYKTVNYGKVKLTLNGKTIANKKVRNGKITFKYQLPKTLKTYKVTASYIKNNKVVTKITDKIKLGYNRNIYLHKVLDVKNGNYINLKASVKNSDGSYTQSGKVAFFIDNKLIKSVKVNYGEASFNYRVYKTAGKHIIKATYYNYLNQVDSKNSLDDLMVTNPLNVPRGVSIKTMKIEYGRDIHLSLGSDYAWSHYLPYDAQYTKGAHIELCSDGYYAPSPTKYRLLTARFYYKNSNGNVIVKRSGARYYSISSSGVIYGYEPYKVEFAYRPMTYSEKRYMGIY